MTSAVFIKAAVKAVISEAEGVSADPSCHRFCCAVNDLNRGRAFPVAPGHIAAYAALLATAATRDGEDERIFGARGRRDVFIPAEERDRVAFGVD